MRKSVRTVRNAKSAAKLKSSVAKQNGARDTDFVHGLAHGLRVLEAFERRRAEMSLSQVARATGLTPATARRSLHTLGSLGYVRQVDKQFFMTARVLALGSSFLRLSGIEETLLPDLRAIVSRCGDTAGIAILVDTEILYIAHYSEQRGVRTVASTGVRYPAYPTSLGRVLLAGLSAEELDRYFAAARFERHTEHTETDPRKLRGILKDARSRGYATIVDELFYGVTSLAVPIVIPGGRVIAALNTSGYSGQITPDHLAAERLPVLRTAAREIGERMARSRVLLHSL
jgi:IclR family pca regulon transcriptional regulator